MGKTVPKILSMAQGQRPKASGHTEDQRHSFSHTDRPSLINNIFIFLGRLLTYHKPLQRGKIWPVVRIVKSWTGYVGMFSQSNSRI